MGSILQRQLRCWLRCILGFTGTLQLLCVLLPIPYRMRELHNLSRLYVLRDIPFSLNLNPVLIEHQGLNMGSSWIIRGFLGAQIMTLR